jgi:hypothetical protein
MDILDTLQKEWGMPGISKKYQIVAQMPERLSCPVPATTFNPPIAPEPNSVLLPPLNIEYPGYDPCNPGCSCVEAGLKMNRISLDPERDCARLEELVRQYPIRPHRHESGGSGFAYSDIEHNEIIKEFSELWFTAAGDLYLPRLWRELYCVPRSKKSNNCPGPQE